MARGRRSIPRNRDRGTIAGSGLALAATVTGTDRGEMLVGTEYRDSIRARGGDDVVRGRGGPDRLHGGFGNDRIHGGRGDDVIHVNDGQRDFVDCGPGRDEVYFDNRDYHDRPGELVDCEIGNPPPIS